MWVRKGFPEEVLPMQRSDGMNEKGDCKDSFEPKSCVQLIQGLTRGCDQISNLEKSPLSTEHGV